jgi:hypothetical protein
MFIVQPAAKTNPSSLEYPVIKLEITLAKTPVGKINNKAF